ncbi:MAG: response regulator transcription factor [Oscillospiraceae bacterium]|nr:response regulator transcription factor [Oscillospiraceae bacterium]
MKILIIEDEKLLADSLKALLEKKGFDVECVYDGESGAEYAETGVYDLLILDVMMPKMDGFEVARSVRAKRCGTPILMLTARSGLEDRIRGLNAGADYYLTKPFDTRELLACVNALLRRQGGQVDELSLGNTALDLSSCTLICGENSVRLSAKEFDIMRFLLQSKDAVLSKEVILAKVWGYDSNAVENHVEVYVGFLRKKLAAIGSNVRIEAVRRLGYRLEVDESC